jgi:hypothetical protein
MTMARTVSTKSSQPIARPTLRLSAALALAAAAVLSAGAQRGGEAPSAERHLRNVRQLTFGGENAEAYFSPDGTRLIFQ